MLRLRPYVTRIRKGQLSLAPFDKGMPTMSDASLPVLTINRSFIHEFIAAEPPCFALGMVESLGHRHGLLALRPGEDIPSAILDQGFNFGHSLLGNDAFEVIHFAFEFYGHKTYNGLINPSHPVAQAVLTRMIETGDYFIFALGASGGVTTFRTEIGQEALSGLKANWSRITHSTTSDPQYRRSVSSFACHPEPAGPLLEWVCRDDPGYLDLSTDRLDLTPRQGEDGEGIR